MDKVRVLGREILITLPIEVRSNLKEGLGKRPSVYTNGICTKTCKLAPSITPITTPIIPNCLARKTIPKMIPRLYRSGANAYIVKRL